MFISYNPALSVYYLESNPYDLYDLIESYYFSFRSCHILSDKARYAVRLYFLLSSAVKVLTELNFYQLENLQNYLVEVCFFLKSNNINFLNYAHSKLF